MKSKHLIVRLASQLPIEQVQIAAPDGIYDHLLGLWVDRARQTPLVNDPDRPKPQTKKCDVETGEDHKGT